MLAFGAIEMAGPFLLLGHAEQTLPSGLTGLLVATVPLFAAVIAFSGGDRSVLEPARAIGLVVGFAGVAVIVAGPGLAVGGGAGLIAVGEVLLVAVCYAIAPFIVAPSCNDVPSLGTITLSLARGRPLLPADRAADPARGADAAEHRVAHRARACCARRSRSSSSSRSSREVGPVRAPLFTYVNPVVAIISAAIILGESSRPACSSGSRSSSSAAGSRRPADGAAPPGASATCRRSRPADLGAPQRFGGRPSDTWQGGMARP